MRGILLPAVFCSLLLSVPALAQMGEEDGSESSWDARITSVEGEVFVYAQTGEGEEAAGVAAEKEMPVNVGDRIETRANGRVEIALDSDSIIDLGPNTIFIVESDSEEEWAFVLELGEMISKLRSVLSSGRKFTFITPTAVAAVRGTEIWAKVADEGDSHFAVIDEGKISVRSTADDSIEPVILKARQQVAIGAGKRLKFATRNGRRMLRARKHKPRKAMMRRMKRIRGRRAVLRRTWKRMARGQRRQMRKNIRQRHNRKMRRMPRKQRRRMQRRMKRHRPTHMKRRMQRRKGRQGRKGRQMRRRGGDRIKDRRGKSGPGGKRGPGMDRRRPGGRRGGYRRRGGPGPGCRRQ